MRLRTSRAAVADLDRPRGDELGVPVRRDRLCRLHVLRLLPAALLASHHELAEDGEEERRADIDCGCRGWCCTSTLRVKCRQVVAPCAQEFVLAWTRRQTRSLASSPRLVLLRFTRSHTRPHGCPGAARADAPTRTRSNATTPTSPGATVPPASLLVVSHRPQLIRSAARLHRIAGPSVDHAVPRKQPHWRLKRQRRLLRCPASSCSLLVVALV
ncbi:hypothetical protein AAT19DRAFT_16720 [Rhodotorula toruloides]|uniref:Uncharacterized protein n=1 Tax=Rhodotorula toruloides TaxID=5286 RepID=A0A2T0A4D8_RHOTO|nr:hypothetical protein AAT19DRAFT_16720 [Rhodotorula toruloides]